MNRYPIMPTRNVFAINETGVELSCPHFIVTRVFKSTDVLERAALPTWEQARR
jgi:hypothetical protein